LKNYFQTGNPFYPLFNSFFKLLHHQPVQEILHGHAIEKTGKISFFKMREVMYGESFWETVLIPIRMFFQGKDNSYQYFQGSLNPILIVFSPFILLNKRYGKDKLYFALFSVFFVIMAYFLTAKQVRYILPVLPFLAILAVMGLKDLVCKLGETTLFSSLRFDRNVRSGFKMVLFVCILSLLVLNFLYLKKRADIIKPFPYVFGQEAKNAFLKRHLLYYDAVEYINQSLPKDAKVFNMFLGRRGYYLDRDYKNESSFGMSTIRHMINSSSDDGKFMAYIRSMNVTHILMRTDLVNRYLQENFSKKEIKRFSNLVSKYWKKVYGNNGCAVWDIQDRGHR
jgi:hypothetical protein